MSFGICAVGYLILIAGVSYLAHLMHIPQHYIVAIGVIMLGSWDRYWRADYRT
jgi:hypothetical protein